MPAFRHSIQWRIFAYYTGLIFLAFGILITAFFLYEKQDKERLLSMQMQASLMRLIPRVFPPLGPHERMGADSSRRSRTAYGGRGAGSAPGGRVSGDGVVDADSGATPDPFANYSSGEPAGGMQDPFASEPVAGEDSSPSLGPRRLGGEAPAWTAAEILRAVRDEGFFAKAVSATGRIVYESENFPSELDGFVLGFEPAAWEHFESGDYLWVGTQVPRQGFVMVGAPKERVMAAVWATSGRAFVVGMVVLTVISALGFGLIHLSLRPIQQISETARRIANGEINEKIDTRNVRSELGMLAGILNETFARLSDAVKRQIQFTSDASHELRTPVAAILAECQFSLKRERSPERYRETIEVCHESAQHMRDLIADLRNLAKFDERQDCLDVQLVELEPFLRNLLNLTAPLAASKRLDLLAEIEPVCARIDPHRIRQAVLNLLSNAIRYTKPGGTVTLACLEVGGQALIEVRDTGIGIPKDKVDHVFDRFYRVDEARHVDSGGVGLGLSIARSIVEAHGGRISVRSKAGVGTRFRIALPSEAPAVAAGHSAAGSETSM